MALDFPNSPTSGQLYAAPNGVTYQWSSTYTAWLPLAVTSAGVGDFYAQGAVSLPVAATTLTLPVVSGNAGGWYSAATGRYTPPAGRYLIFAQTNGGWSGGATNIACTLRKNGSAAVGTNNTTGAANYTTSTPLAVVVDANGTDYWDVQGSSSAGVGISYPQWFGAFPISAAGPAAGTVGSWRRIGRTVPVAGQATIDFQNIPSDINDLELRYDVAPATNNGNLLLRFFDSTGTIDAGASSYGHGNFYINNAAAQGSTVVYYGSTSGQSGIVINLLSSGWGVSSTYSIQGRLSVSDIRENTRRKYVTFQSMMVESTNTYAGYLSGFGQRVNAGSLTGVRLLFDNGNFAAGGAVSLYGSP